MARIPRSSRRRPRGRVRVKGLGNKYIKGYVRGKDGRFYTKKLTEGKWKKTGSHNGKAVYSRVSKKTSTVPQKTSGGPKGPSRSKDGLKVPQNGSKKVLDTKQLKSKSNRTIQEGKSKVDASRKLQESNRSKGKEALDDLKATGQTDITTMSPNGKNHVESELNRIKALPKANEDGSTFNLDGTAYNDGGFVVPVGARNLNRNDVTADNIEAFVKENAAAIGTNNFKVGVYKFPDSDEMSIDLNIIVPKTKQKLAVKIADDLGHESIFSLDTFENIKTGQSGLNPKSLKASQLKTLAKEVEFDAPVSILNKNGRSYKGFGNVHGKGSSNKEIDIDGVKLSMRRHTDGEYIIEDLDGTYLWDSKDAGIVDQLQTQAKANPTAFKAYIKNSQSNGAKYYKDQLNASSLEFDNPAIAKKLVEGESKHILKSRFNKQDLEGDFSQRDRLKVDNTSAKNFTNTARNTDGYAFTKDARLTSRTGSLQKVYESTGIKKDLRDLTLADVTAMKSTMINNPKVGKEGYKRLLVSAYQNKMSDMATKNGFRKEMASLKNVDMFEDDLDIKLRAFAKKHSNPDGTITISRAIGLEKEPIGPLGESWGLHKNTINTFANTVASNKDGFNVRNKTYLMYMDVYPEDITLAGHFQDGTMMEAVVYDWDEIPYKNFNYTILD